MDITSIKIIGSILSFLFILLFSKLSIILLLFVLGFLGKYFWSSSKFPFDYTLNFFCAIIIVNKAGLVALILFILISDALPTSLAQGGFDPLTVPVYLSFLIVCSVSAFIGGPIILSGIIAALVHFPIVLALQGAMGYFNPLSIAWSVSGLGFSMFYFWRLWPILAQFL